MKRYELINHTADIGLRAWGKDLSELFVNAALGMFEIMADLKNVQAKEKVVIKLEAPNIEELFLSWLSELLFYWNSQGLIFKEFSIAEISQTYLNAQLKGEEIVRQRHILKSEIKAATYHGLEVCQVKDKWQAVVIFDV